MSSLCKQEYIDAALKEFTVFTDSFLFWLLQSLFAELGGDVQHEIIYKEEKDTMFTCHCCVLLPV